MECNLPPLHAQSARRSMARTAFARDEIRNTNISSEIVKIISSHYNRDENLFKFCV